MNKIYLNLIAPLLLLSLAYGMPEKRDISDSMLTGIGNFIIVEVNIKISNEQKTTQHPNLPTNSEFAKIIDQQFKLHKLPYCNMFNKSAEQIGEAYKSYQTPCLLDFSFHLVKASQTSYIWLFHASAEELCTIDRNNEKSLCTIWLYEMQGCTNTKDLKEAIKELTDDATKDLAKNWYAANSLNKEVHEGEKSSVLEKLW